MNFETQALAIGIIRALRERAQSVGDVTQGLPGDLAREYRGLVSRAVGVTENTTCGEVDSIFADYMELTARCGIGREMN